MIDPNKDGIDHINIYSKGQTNLGKLLTNFSDIQVQCSVGKFKTIEGLIYFLGCFDNRLRYTNGFNSKKLGRELDRGIRLPDDIFRKIIIEAMEYKANVIEKELKDSNLPFKHYYNYGGKVIEVTSWQWQIDEWERIRQEKKNEII